MSMENMRRPSHNRFKANKNFSRTMKQDVQQTLPNRHPLRLTLLATLLFAFLCPAVSSLVAEQNSSVLWQIGMPDGTDTEFALAPADHRKFKEDGFFLVGESDPKRDWPYAHPGPSDTWAGKREHTFTILFGLKAPPANGECQLALALVDTHPSGPPTLRLQINGHPFERALPNGAGEAAINGEPAKGRLQRLEIPFRSEFLHAGDNEIQITTVSGCWMLYDAVTLTTPAGTALQPVATRTVVSSVQAVPALQKVNGQSTQPIVVTLRHFDAPQTASLQIENLVTQAVELQRGAQTIKLDVPTVSAETIRILSIVANGKTVASSTVTLKPVRNLTVYILPHSHTDIGYTAIQTAIERKQVQNLVDGIAAAKRTANYPEGARFIWNVEVSWAAELYLHRLNEQQRAEFFDAVKQGQVVLNGMYLNELTGLCRPEELLELFRYATQLSAQTGVPIDSAMISDVPGYTWGTVTAMAQAGIKYFSVAPNWFDRIGTILREWANKPFYWVGPDGHSKVLVWIPFSGYALSHRYHDLSPKLVSDLAADLDQRGYPFDITYVRWAGHGDNAVPDPAICEFVKDWNAKYISPHFIISGTGEAFRAFEQRYGDKLPLVRGDWTPYWEDGAGSSSLETAMNRQSSDRLSQAEALFAMLKPGAFPQPAFHDAWCNVLLYSEHTWGAWCSVTQPERKETIEQWEIKKSYADEADRQSRELLSRALQSDASPTASGALEIINTLSWSRTELVTVPADLSSAGDRVLDNRDRAVPSQRLRSGELVFLAKDVPPFATQRYQVVAGKAFAKDRASARGAMLDSGKVRLRVDEKTGGIVELTTDETGHNFADTSSGEALNDYLYFLGDDLKNLLRNGPVKLSVGEAGPLVASLVIESDAPGCHTLRRELRVVTGQDHVELVNLVDKARAPRPASGNYKDTEGKESLNFAFCFHVPDGEMVVDIPLGMFRPEADQMPGACKNWLTAGRWVDVSNQRLGVTWVTLDAPLIQVGELSARLLNSQKDPDVWRKEIKPTHRLYSWAMNNHWGTNYRAYQEGPTIFRFILRPHRQPDPAEASRFANGFSQPLLVRQAGGDTPGAPLLRVTPDDVLVTTLKPSDDGKALIVRLFNASATGRTAKLEWGMRKPKAVFFSSTSERGETAVTGGISVPASGLVTIRAEWD
jgi:hypothetical protein